MHYMVAILQGKIQTFEFENSCLMLNIDILLLVTIVFENTDVTIIESLIEKNIS